MQTQYNWSVQSEALIHPFTLHYFVQYCCSQQAEFYEDLNIVYIDLRMCKLALWHSV